VGSLHFVRSQSWSAGNGGQGATALLASTATVATWYQRVRRLCDRAQSTHAIGARKRIRSA
jgi:hypothetical protein